MLMTKTHRGRSSIVRSVNFHPVTVPANLRGANRNGQSNQTTTLSFEEGIWKAKRQPGPGFSQPKRAHGQKCFFQTPYSLVAIVKVVKSVIKSYYQKTFTISDVPTIGGVFVFTLVFTIISFFNTTGRLDGRAYAGGINGSFPFLTS